jgi:molybdate transport repressor ModE-like protein
MCETAQASNPEGYYASSMVGTGKLEWNNVRSFLVVARVGTMSAAARELGVRHTTVSRQVAALEQALGASLLVRHSGGVTLTDLAKRLLPAGQTLERGMTAFMEAAQSRPTPVRLALPSGVSVWLAKRLTAFQASVQGVQLEITSGSQTVDLARGEADLAVRVGQITDESLVAVRLGLAGWSLYASDRYLERRPGPVDPRELVGHDIIGFHSRLAGVIGAKWIEAHGAGATVAMRLSDMTEVLEAAVAGAGLAILPCVLGDADPRMHRLTGEVLGTQPISLVYKREVGREPPVRAVIRFVTAVFREQAAVILGDSKRL